MTNLQDNFTKPSLALNSFASSENWPLALLNLADVVSPLIHEFGNMLNNIVLQAALLSREVPEPLRDKVATFRSLGLQGGKMLSQLDAFRRAIQPPRRLVNLNDVVNDIAHDYHNIGIDIEINTAEALPPIWGNEPDVFRLITLLGRSALTVGAHLNIRTEQDCENVLLTVEDSGPQRDVEGVDRFFDAFAPSRSGDSSFERAICQTIVRRLQGNIRAENLPGGGMAVIVEFPASSVTN